MRGVGQKGGQTWVVRDVGLLGWREEVTTVCRSLVLVLNTGPHVEEGARAGGRVPSLTSGNVLCTPAPDSPASELPVCSGGSPEALSIPVSGLSLSPLGTEAVASAHPPEGWCRRLLPALLCTAPQRWPACHPSPWWVCSLSLSSFVGSPPKQTTCPQILVLVSTSARPQRQAP